MTIKLTKDGGAVLDGSGHQNVLRALAQQHAQVQVAGVAAFTDNGGGTNNGAIYLSAPAVAAANSGGNLADKTTTEAAAAKVKNALAELIAKTNEYTAILGLDTLTDSTGGSSADGTIAAMDASVTGAATGVLQAETNTYIAAVNKALVSVAAVVNKCARALGYAEVTTVVETGAEVPPIITTIPSLGTSLGTAASPGVTKATADALLVAQRNSIKALSAKLDAFTAARAPLVLSA